MVYNKTNLDELSDLEVRGAIIACNSLDDISSILESGLLSMSKEEKHSFIDASKYAAGDKEFLKAISLESSLETRFKYIEDMTAEATEKKAEQKRQAELTNMIKEMLKEKLSFEQISKITGKPIDEIKKISNAD